MVSATCEQDPQFSQAERLGSKLLSEVTSLASKHRVLFALRSISNSASQHALEAALAQPSDLLRHEIAYCLGQQQRPEAATALAKLLHDPKEHPMVRHEAAEALGAIGTPFCLSTVESFCDDPCLEVSQTCQLAVQRIEYLGRNPDVSSQQYLTVDPAPPADANTSVGSLCDTLLDEAAPIFERYRAMFALRNKGGKPAIDALGLSLAGKSALLKHEVAYVLGQMADARAVEYLRKALMDSNESAMVRHEAAEALGGIADSTSIELLQAYRSDHDPIVADSCEVALDMLAFEQSNDFEYVDLGR